MHDPNAEELRAEMQRLVTAGKLEGGASDAASALLGLFLGNLPDFLLLLSLDGTVLFMNRARAGVDIPSVLGHKLAEYYSAEADRIALERAFARVVATGENTSFENHARYTDGSEHAFLTRLAPVKLEGRVLALALASTELTEQKRIEEALRASVERDRVTLAATGMGLWSWDLEGHAVTWDAATCSIWGVTPETVPKDFPSYLALVHPDEREHHEAMIAEMRRTGVYPQLEHRILRPDGSVRRVLLRATVTRAEDGRVIKLMGGVLDVTEQREIEERSLQAQKIEAIGQLSAGIAHNFNNMLMIMLPSIELAMRNAAPSDASLLRSAHDAGLRAAELVRQLMILAGAPRTHTKQTEDVNALVERTVAICRRAFDCSIEIELRASPRPVFVLADSTQLEQVLLNLLINARDALSEAGRDAKRVRVQVDYDVAPPLGAFLRPAGYAAIRVSDNGIGMSAAVRERIYEPFFTTKDVGRGTGLGLSTARGIVVDHGGLLACESAEGRGTTFAVFLPIEERGPVPEPRSLTPEPFRALGRPTILVVDDEAPVRAVVSQMLEHSGFEVIPAGSGREALAIVGREDVRQRLSLVLLDFSMPDLSGKETRRELKVLAPELPVVYFSGFPLDDCSDVAAFIQKPTTYSELLNTVRRVLEP